MNISNVDINHNMLIIGYCNIRTPSVIQCFLSAEECSDWYGENNTITQCYKDAKNIGAEYIFTVSYNKYSDLSTIVDLLQSYDFTYICPVDIYASDHFTNPYKNQKTTFYVQYILEQMHRTNNSIVITTDKLASLYEDMDAFISESSTIISNLKVAMESSVVLNNFIYVDNMLKDYTWANVILAATLCVSDIPIYPISNLFGETVYDIDKMDINDEQVYFRMNYPYNQNISTTIENLVNFNPKSINKPVIVDRILKYIARELDFTSFLGKPFTEYRKILIKQYLENYLKQWVGYIINDYKITGIEEKKNEVAGAVSIYLYYEIQPKMTKEWYKDVRVI